jgi:hypothetical protein
VEAARVQILNRNTGLIVDDDYRTLSESGAVDVPIIGLEGEPLRIWVKLPTHLSVVMDTDAIDGAVLVAPAFIGGDADGDNCITNDDVDIVTNDLGAGGVSATYVPPSDVTGNGVVTIADLALVSNNLGQCGDDIITGAVDRPVRVPTFTATARPNPSGAGTMVDFTLPGDASVTITVYNALGHLVRRVTDSAPYGRGPQSVAFDTTDLRSGVYFCHITAAMDGGDTKSEVIKLSIVR